MNRFDYEFPVRIHFGQGCFEDSLKQELQKYGKNVMLAYGGGSLKRTGLYDRIVAMLGEAGKPHDRAPTRRQHQLQSWPGACRIASCRLSPYI